MEESKETLMKEKEQQIKEDKLTEGFEKLLKKAGAKIIIVCSTSPNEKCEEDLNGYCYHCGRDMLNDGGKG